MCVDPGSLYTYEQSVMPYSFAVQPRLQLYIASVRESSEDVQSFPFSLCIYHPETLQLNFDRDESVSWRRSEQS